jgi:hypothetical protein
LRVRVKPSPNLFFRSLAALRYNRAVSGPRGLRRAGLVSDNLIKDPVLCLEDFFEDDFPDR